MSTPQTHKLVVAIDDPSLEALADAGARLYAFLGFESSNRSCVPLVFKAVPQLAENIVFAWTETYQGFLSTIALAAGAGNPAQRTIPAQSTAAANLGDILTASPAVLEFKAAPGDSAGAVTFRNARPESLTCGLSYGDDRVPVCAATLLPNIDLVIAPAQIIFLMLSTSVFEVGSWVTASAGTGLRVDMTGADVRNVSFTLNGGWAVTDSWAQVQPAGAPLADILRKTPNRNVSRSKFQGRILT